MGSCLFSVTCWFCLEGISDDQTSLAAINEMLAVILKTYILNLRATSSTEDRHHLNTKASASWT